MRSATASRESLIISASPDHISRPTVSNRSWICRAALRAGLLPWRAAGAGVGASAGYWISCALRDVCALHAFNGSAMPGQRIANLSRTHQIQPGPTGNDRVQSE